MRFHGQAVAMEHDGIQEITNMNDHWTEQDRDMLDEILDQLIPANPQKGIPSAGSFGVGEFLVSRAAADEDISSALQEVLSTAASMEMSVNPKMVSQLETRCKTNFALLLKLTYMGYYSQPEIRSSLGLGEWPVHPNGYEVPVEPVEMIRKLVAPVTMRGSIYREPNDKKQA